MQDLLQPEVYQYETPLEPSLKQLKNLLLEDGVDLSGNIVGILVKTPPDKFFGVERYDLEVFYGEAYSDLTSQTYRHRGALTWLTRGAKDDPALVVSNLETSIAEVQAGREPFAWQVEQVTQGSNSIGLTGAVLVTLLLVAAALYALNRKRHAAAVARRKENSSNSQAASYTQRARAGLEQAFLDARYGDALNGALGAHTPEAKQVRALLFGEAQLPREYGEAEAAVRAAYPAPLSAGFSSAAPRSTPFDKDIEAAFNKLDRMMRAKQLELERCYYTTDTLEAAHQRVAELRSNLLATQARSTGESAQRLGEQLERLDELLLQQRARQDSYEKIARRLQIDMQAALGYKEELLQKREVYALLEASVALQRDLNQAQADVTSPSGDIQGVLQDVDDLIEAYMELPLPSYTPPPLADIESLLA